MIVENLYKFIEYKGISIAAFEKKIGMSNNSFRKSFNNKGAIGSDKLENILQLFPEINSEWLLTGQGEMLKPANITNEKSDINNLILSQQHTIKNLSETIENLSQTIKNLTSKKEL